MPSANPLDIESIESEAQNGLKRTSLHQSQLSNIAKTAVISNLVASNCITHSSNEIPRHTDERDAAKSNDAKTFFLPSAPVSIVLGPTSNHTGLENGLVVGSYSDTASIPSGPSTAPTSPRILPMRQNSGTTTPRTRPPATTLNIPGMTRSKVSVDGRIAPRDVGSKLVIVMVGLPARGKSYITQKLKRYLSWQQHNTRIFNVGNRRRLVAATSAQPRSDTPQPNGQTHQEMDIERQAAHILLNGELPKREETINGLSKTVSHGLPDADHMDQDASFFDPNNEQGTHIREQVALSTLDELLDYLLYDNGSVGILDATNSTIERRKVVYNRIKERAPKIGILFIESICKDENLLESNMRLKLQGPDYKDKDPESSLADFKKRVAAYESAYVPLGDEEEKMRMQFIQMIDVGRKVVFHDLKGFLSGGISSYLTTFNLAPRQIFITRHGESEDNTLGKIGGNSNITPRGKAYSTALYNFVTLKRKEWLVQKKDDIMSATFPPQPGENTPPYPQGLEDLDNKNFCVWTSMLKRSVQSADDFELDDDYDVKNWEMLNELNSGALEGLTYQQIQEQHPEEYAKRHADKLHYTYPGVGGEGYLQVISRLRDMVREIERITDHVLIIAHRCIARVLLAYFMDLTRDDIADMHVPLGMLYCIEPKPYGYDKHCYKYNEETQWFDEVPDWQYRKEPAGSYEV